MNLNMIINNVKCINLLEFSFPLEPGIYAITGENGSGKSTLVACASSVFFSMPMIEYFGRPDSDASIKFEMDGATREWKFEYNNKRWNQGSSLNKMKINGFYEGSIMYGNRFKNAYLSKINNLDDIKESDVEKAEEFVLKNLGLILHDNTYYYENLYSLKDNTHLDCAFSGKPYFIKTESGRFISQLRMSTGENLLISILHSLSLVKEKRKRNTEKRYGIVFLDEIELALHPSALRRLFKFLQSISEEYSLAIFFSTHSLDLIRDIKPENIYYLNKRFDGILYVTNPCYPGFATKNLYSDDGFGDDLLVLVEDDLAKLIVEDIIKKENLRSNVTIKILPTGGWTNTIALAFEIKHSGIVPKGTKVAVVLDGDIKDEVASFKKGNKRYSSVEPSFLPVPSLEKYLYNNLYKNFDVELSDKLENYIFTKKPLKKIIEEYHNEVTSRSLTDNDGKTFYGKLISDMRPRDVNRKELVEYVVKNLYRRNQSDIKIISEYLINLVNITANLK